MFKKLKHYLTHELIEELDKRGALDAVFCEARLRKDGDLVHIYVDVDLDKQNGESKERSVDRAVRDAAQQLGLKILHTPRATHVARPKEVDEASPEIKMNFVRVSAYVTVTYD